MDTKQKKRRSAEPAKRPAKAGKAAPARRRKTGAPDTPDREERRRRIQQRRRAKAKIFVAVPIFYVVAAVSVFLCKI